MTQRQQARLDRHFLNACEYCLPDVVQDALKKGANVHAMDQRRESGLHLCLGTVSPESTAIAQLLIAKGIDLNAVNSAGETPLFLATSLNTRLAELLLDSGAKVTVRNDTGWTPLHNIAANGNVSMLEIFLEKGADPNAKNKKGITALHQAAQYGCVEVVHVLIDRVSEACRATVRKDCLDMGWDAARAVFEARDARAAIEEICRRPAPLGAKP